MQWTVYRRIPLIDVLIMMCVGMDIINALNRPLCCSYVAAVAALVVFWQDATQHGHARCIGWMVYRKDI
jgi:hypothetical protein